MTAGMLSIPASALGAQSAGPAAVAGAEQRSARPSFRLGVMAIAGTAYVDDEAGVTVRPGLAPGLAADAAWIVGRSWTAAATIRGSAAPVTIAEDGDTRSEGTVTQADLLGAIERSVGDRFLVRVGAGASWIRGPSDVVPFRYGNNGRFQPTGEVGALMRITNGRPLFASLAWQASRFGSATLGDPIREPGWLNRALVGVRYGR